MSIEGLHRIDSTRLEVPKGYKTGMRTNGIIYIDEVLEKALEKDAIEQVANVATLPGIVRFVPCDAGYSYGLWVQHRGRGCV